MRFFWKKQRTAEHGTQRIAPHILMRFVAVLAVTVIIGMRTAQPLHAQAGGAAVPFLLIGPDARANGMGDVGTGLADDLNAIHWNPGGLAFQYDRQFAISFSRWLPQFNADLSYGHAAYSQYVKEVGGTIAANFVLFNLGEFTRTDFQGRPLGTFRSNEFMVGASYSTAISEDVGVGIHFKYIQSNLGATADASGGGIGRSAAADIGVLWQPSKLKIADIDLSNRFSLGANLRNLGPSVTYNTFSDPLPTMLRLGMGATLVRDEFNELTWAVDYAKLLVRRYPNGDFDRVVPAIFTAWGATQGFELSSGLEYWYDRTIALRAGYFVEPTRAGNRNYLTAGLGVHFDIFYANFSYIIPIEQNNPLANTLRFALIVNWENGKQLAGIKPTTN